MELTLKEKLALQTAVRLGLERLQAGIADPDERQKVQDEIRNALDKLNGTSSVVAKSNFQGIAPIKPEVISDLSILFNDKRMIEFGKRAISHLLLSNYNGEGKIKASTDAIQYAMYNKKFGWISFEWGNPGVYPPNFKDVQSKKNYFANVNPKQLFSHGYGLSHTLAKRLWEEKNIVECSGQDALEIIELIPKAIMYGNIQNKGNKIEIRYNNNVVVLAKARNTQKRGRPLIVVKDKRLLKALKKTESWLITSFLSTNTYTVNFNEIGNVFESAGVESCRRVTCGHYTGEAAHTPAPVPNKLLATWFGAHLAQPDNNAGRALYGYESGGPSHPFLSTHHEKKRWQDMVGAADSVDSTLPHDQTEGKENMKDGIMESAAGSRFSIIFAMLDRAQGVEEHLRVLDAAFETGQIFVTLSKIMDDAAASFRESDKTAQDCVILAQLLKKFPWALQEEFWGNPDNEDLKEFLPKSPAEMTELENRLLTETKERGARILDRLPDMTEELDRVGNLLEETRETRKELRFLEWCNAERLTARVRKKLEEQTSRLNAEASVIFSHVKEAVFAESSISEEEAMEWAKSDAVQINETTFKFMASPKIAVIENGRTHYVDGAPGPDKETILKEVATIYRLTNGNLKKLNVTSEQVEGRSYFSHANNTVYWLDTNIDTLYHEAGHALDKQNTFFVAPAQQFIRNRATGKPASLAKMTQNSAYGREEKAFPDTFIHPYVGKIYPNSSEVTSMGLQAFANIDYMRKLMQNDPEHLKLTLGTLTAQGSKLPAKAVKLRPQRHFPGDYSAKVDAWNSAIDEAVEAVDLKNKLMSPKGYHGYMILPFQDESGRYFLPSQDEGGRYFEVRRKRVARPLYVFLERDNMPDILRAIYLCIAQNSGLLPDMGFNAKNYREGFHDALNARVPDWFTPITQLPRI